MPDGPADEHRGRCRHAQPRHLPAGPRTRAVAGGVRGTVGATGRRAVRGEPEPDPVPHAVPGHPEAGAGQRPGVVPGQPRRTRDRRRGARRAVRRGQLGVTGPGRLGSRLGGLAGRAGDHPVHLLPAGRWHQPGPAVGGDHLRGGTHPDGAAGCAAFPGDRVHRHGDVRRDVPAGRVRDVPVLPRRGRHRHEPAAAAGVRGRGAAHDRRGPAGPRAHLRAEVFARLQRARLARCGVHGGAGHRVRPDAPAGRRGRPVVDRAPGRTEPPARCRGPHGRPGGGPLGVGRRHVAAPVRVRGRHRGDAAVGGPQRPRPVRTGADRAAGRAPGSRTVRCGCWRPRGASSRSSRT